MRCSKIPPSRLVPFEIIEGAMARDPDAFAYILKHFEGYLITLSTRESVNDYGRPVVWVDYDLKRRLENKLISTIIKKFEFR